MIRFKLLLLSLGSGLLLSMPWLCGTCSWILFIAFVPLLIVKDQILQYKNNKTGSLFFYALISFFSWNMLSTWWISYVSFEGMLMIVGINSFLMACVWWLSDELSGKFGNRNNYFSLIVCWLTFEYIHFNWSMQWPWLTLGNGFSNMVKWIQWYEYTGVLGGSLWILLINILLFSAYQYWRQEQLNSAIKTGLIGALVVMAPMGLSIYRYQTYEPSGKNVQVVVIQPDIDPYQEKFSGMSALDQTNRLINLAGTIITDSTAYLLAPETSLETFWEDDSLNRYESFQHLVMFLNKYPYVKLVAGAVTQKKLNKAYPVTYTSRRTDNGDLYEVYNSAIAFDKSSHLQIGHKNILVSGVEKIPFQQYFSWLGRFTVDAGGTSGSLGTGDGPNVFKNKRDEGVGAIICFESAFGQYVGRTVKEGAEMLFMMTNDGWWKESAGVAQHFGFARLRAIETRRSIARSANTGISGFINERGDVIKKAPINTAVAIRAPLTLNRELTFYVRMGDYLGKISSVLAILLVGYRLVHIRNKYGN